MQLKQRGQKHNWKHFKSAVALHVVNVLHTLAAQGKQSFLLATQWQSLKNMGFYVSVEILNCDLFRRQIRVVRAKAVYDKFLFFNKSYTNNQLYTSESTSLGFLLFIFLSLKCIKAYRCDGVVKMECQIEVMKCFIHWVLTSCWPCTPHAAYCRTESTTSGGSSSQTSL